MASELFFGLEKLGCSCWLDVKMTKCDVAAMEEGVRNSKFLIAIVTDNGKDSYFSRWMCREEVKWALDAGKQIVPLVAAADKLRIGDFIAEGNTHKLDFGSYNFVHLDRSGPLYLKASLETILEQVDRVLLDRTVSPHPAPEPQPEPAPYTGTYRTCLDRKYVQKEVRWARQHGRPVLTIFEDEERRQGFFDYGKARVKYGGTEWGELLDVDPVTYTRDKIKAEVMVDRLLEMFSASVQQADPVSAADAPLNKPGCWDFFLCHGQAAAGDQVKTLCLLLEKRGKKVWHDNSMLNRLPVAMEEGVKHSGCFLLFLSGDPDLSASVPAAREFYLHLALQPPPVLYGERTAGGQLRAIETQLREPAEQAKWVGENRFPICLSDAGAADCAVEAQLRQGSVHALVWCAKGDGWEQRTDSESGAELMPSLNRIADIIRELPTTGCAPPAVVVVCLQHGARRAAERLMDAGVPTVVWLSLDAVNGADDSVA
eukprot:SAG22_NODE_1126_length_5474_cov_4.748093_1_plen_485_part_00